MANHPEVIKMDSQGEQPRILEKEPLLGRESQGMVRRPQIAVAIVIVIVNTKPGKGLNCQKRSWPNTELLENVSTVAKRGT